MRGAGLEVEALIEYVSLFQQGDATAQVRKQILIEQRERLEQRLQEMQDTLQRLNFKIQKYEKIVLHEEEKLR